MTTFSQLPAAVQQAITSSDYKAHDFSPSGAFAGMKFLIGQSAGPAGVWVVPELCYDFSEANYTARTVNLTTIAALDVGPAKARACKKTDPTLPAWIVIIGSDDVPSRVYECV